MKATIKRSHLIRLVELVRATASPEQTAVLPIFSAVRVDVAFGQVTLATLSMDGAAKATTPVVTSDEGGACAVSMRRFHDTLRHLAGGSDDQIELTLTGSQLRLEGSDGSARLPTFEGADQLLDIWQRPIPESAATVAVDATELRDGLRAVRYAVSKDSGRPAFCGVCLDVRPDGIHVVATDGARIAVYRAGGSADRAASIVLPPSTVECFIEVLDGASGVIQLDADATTAILTGATAGATATIRAIGVATPYPDWRVPLAHFGAVPTSLRVPGGRVKQLLQRAIAIAGAQTSAAIGISQSSLSVEAESVDGRADGHVDGEAVGGTIEPERVPVNPRFALDAVDACGDGDVLLAILIRAGQPMGINVQPVDRPERLRNVLVRKTSA